MFTRLNGERIVDGNGTVTLMSFRGFIADTSWKLIPDIPTYDSEVTFRVVDASLYKQVLLRRGGYIICI